MGGIVRTISDREDPCFVGRFRPPVGRFTCKLPRVTADVFRLRTGSQKCEKPSHSTRECFCGFIQKAIFSPNTEPVSLDAALVEIKARMPDSGHFVIKDKTQAWELGYSVDALPTYNTGAIRRTIIPDDFNKPIIKSGTSTGLTRSSFRLIGAEVRIIDHDVLAGTQDNEPIVMKGQYEIEPCHDLRTFFDSGDSGSAVFMKDSDGSLSCIGIAIGKTSYHSTVVTPIGAILDALGINDSDVTRFI
ncbi:hypothetical protein FSP39_016154 [Pinctada imbricata]|uniref:Uncharacterized protein n=1 Tax=Pinctada imbricata TaxID=66713 RepID=A0AA88YEM1_PINIB|nr:hypothetical protein FSP39_016154 [Pinctada imbricata]